jgi:hypothetical protein
MISHWINELMNLLAGNSRYVHYTQLRKLVFIGILFLFLVISIFLFLFV